MRINHIVMVLLAATLAAGCGNSSPTAPTANLSLSGSWAGIPRDSSISMGGGGSMGEAAMGTMTWSLLQVGDVVTGPVTFSGMQGRLPATFTGKMTGDTLSFSLNMPDDTMFSGCEAKATGTARLNAAGSSMTGTYAGANDCTGPFTAGTLTVTRR